MANRLSQILTSWAPQKDELQWVLGTIIETCGPSYRKAGAMMLINSLGQWQGLLSGGCLESDIMRQAREVMDSGRAKIITYDMQDEDDLSWQLGIGCGGMVKILLQAVDQENDYLFLPQILDALNQGQECVYFLAIHEGFSSGNTLYIDSEHQYGDRIDTLYIVRPGELNRPEQLNDLDPPGLLLPIKPDPRLVIFGGGVDSRPLVNMAAELGWHIELVDPRPAYARPQHFSRATVIHRIHPSDCGSTEWLQQADAAMIMNHNIELDAACLSALKHSKVRYLGLLGPNSRKERVLQTAQLDSTELPAPISGPAGLNLGGELPESIALSILAEIHAVLESCNALPLSPQTTICTN